MNPTNKMKSAATLVGVTLIGSTTPFSGANAASVLPAPYETEDFRVVDYDDSNVGTEESQTLKFDRFGTTRYDAYNSNDLVGVFLKLDSNIGCESFDGGTLSIAGQNLWSPTSSDCGTYNIDFVDVLTTGLTVADFSGTGEIEVIVSINPYAEWSGDVILSYTYSVEDTLPPTVPLPASLALMIPGLAGLGFIGRRRRLSKQVAQS